MTLALRGLVAAAVMFAPVVFRPTTAGASSNVSAGAVSGSVHFARPVPTIGSLNCVNTTFTLVGDTEAVVVNSSGTEYAGPLHITGLGTAPNECADSGGGGLTISASGTALNGARIACAPLTGTFTRSGTAVNVVLQGSCTLNGLFTYVAFLAHVEFAPQNPGDGVDRAISDATFSGPFSMFTAICPFVTGTVTNQGDPLSGVLVSVSGPSICPVVSSITDAFGAYAVNTQVSPTQTIQLVAKKTGYQDATPVWPVEKDFAMYHTVTTWTDPGCREDGHPMAASATCTPNVDDTLPVSTGAVDCTGAVYCDLTLQQLQAAGYDTTDLQGVEARLQAEGLARLNGVPIDDAPASAPLSAAPETFGPSRSSASATSSSNLRWSALIFGIAQISGNNCSGSAVVDDGHIKRCAWLFHAFVHNCNNSSGNCTVQWTGYPARSGLLNDVTKECARDVGPIPVDGPDGKYISYVWGRNNGKRQDFRLSSSISLSPGYWPLDPRAVTCYNGTRRTGFLIHGGSGLHDYWRMGTKGCIRLPALSINGLRNMWYNRTPNNGGNVPLWIWSAYR